MVTYFNFTPSRHLSLIWEASGLFLKVGRFERWVSFTAPAR